MWFCLGMRQEENYKKIRVIGESKDYAENISRELSSCNENELGSEPGTFHCVSCLFLMETEIIY